MKIEYTEPLMKVKEIRRRRCVVAQSANTPYGTTVGGQDFEKDEDTQYDSSDLFN